MCMSGGENIKLKNISAIKWIGGKHGKEDIYIDMMPKHRIFCDCTFGSGAVTFAKEDINPAGYMTVVNDKNDGLVNFLMQLIDNKDEMKRRLSQMPFSETLYEKYKWEPIPEDPLEKAIRFYYLMRLTFSGGGHKYRNGLGSSKTQNKATTFRHSVNLLDGMQERALNWTILNRTMFDIIDFYDTADTLFYIDPPYVGYEDIYTGDFQRINHVQLKKRLSNIKGKVMVCYYPDKLINRLYRDDIKAGSWYCTTYNTASQLEVREEGDVCPVRTELILTNYKPPEKSKQLSLFERGDLLG